MTLKLNILCSPSYRPEREYICRVLLREFLGLDYTLQYEERQNWKISTGNGKELLLPDILFQTPENQWLRHESLPAQPLACWDTEVLCLEFPSMIDKKLPVIYGDLDFHKKVSHVSDNTQTTLSLPIDIFGSSFFILTRYEEIIKRDRDEHDRFPAWASLAYQEGFLERPIVNEYLEILWAYLKKIEARLKRRKRSFQIQVTCDVDHICQEGLKKPLRQIGTIGADLLRRKNPKLAIRSFVNYFAVNLGNFSFDPLFSAIYWIMEANEKAGNRVVFYFKAGCTSQKYDSNYSLDDQLVRKLLRDIHERGHEIGLHPSYKTYNDKNQLALEANNLRRVLKQENICQNNLGSRQHYLRWDSAITPVILQDAGIDYDTTLSYADHIGFRCGVCYEYPLYDLFNRLELMVSEQPLIIMEGTLLSEKYMNLDNYDRAATYITSMKNKCHLFQGNYILLWHNALLTESYHRNLYRTSII